jgi:phosphoglycerol transferase MdoB-like AlkP superfamily enzyme
MSLNGLYSLANALRDMAFRGREGAKWMDDDLIAEDRLTVQKLVVAPGERLIDPSHRTVLRQGDVGSSLVLKGKNGKPINVVVVMMESFSARYVGACGAQRSFTPSIDALAKESISFDRTLSAGTHTHQGIFAIQLGFPNLPGFETLMESGISNQHFLSAPGIFQDRGYQTMFLYNGDFAWDNMRGFFNKQGVERFIGRDEMKDDAEYVDEVWGVSDADVFTRANREFEAASKKGPFYATIMTLSNHAPFQVPPVPGAEPITDQGEYNPRLTALRYADWAVGQFVAEARKLSYFDNTLFVFVGDHGFHVPPVMTELHLLYHHVPLLFFAPGLTDQRGVVDHRIASHNNIIPSILGLLGITDSQHASWGRSLFNDSFPDENFVVFKNSGGGRAVGMARGDKLLVLGSAMGKPLLLNFDLGPNPTFAKVEDPVMEKKMEKELRDYVEMALDDLSHNRAGPVAATVEPKP